MGDVKKIDGKIRVADNMFSRMKGLMFCKEMIGYDGLLIVPGTSIHTFFMKMDIDVLFLDKNNKVVKIIREMKPWRHTLIYFRARKVLELKGGSLRDDLNVGDYVELCLS